VAELAPSTAACRLCLWRHPPAASVCGGTCHVSAGRRAATLQVVFFINYFQRWSFLAIQWGKWSFLAKLLQIMVKMTGLTVFSWCCVLPSC
jgi:hypothetical protein